jgi:hypothetical protein
MRELLIRNVNDPSSPGLVGKVGDRPGQLVVQIAMADDLV